ncbi:germinal center-associated signaling and motility protein isoform X6 [Psammomys obesus]|uniref:germinal center-associated signaling and motility protein isoform X6 n=1 Tax=Psammomys obesus TaxID=48139 RepID=UPI0024535F4D|nr:germinal center-associated signaling and motility protein isoform X6 [Psammomys obesus]
MGNSLQRKSGYFRGWSCCHIVEGCSCLPWKNISTFKARQPSPKQNEGMMSVPIQDNANQTYTEELCYFLVDHKALRERPPGNSAEVFYENISNKAERPRESAIRTETEYSVLRFPSTPQPLPSTEDEYELLVPSRFPLHSPQRPWPPTAPFETHFSHLQ